MIIVISKEYKYNKYNKHAVDIFNGIFYKRELSKLSKLISFFEFILWIFIFSSAIKKILWSLNNVIIMLKYLPR